MTNKAKRISVISLIAVMIMAAISMFAFMQTTTARADDETPANTLGMKVKEDGYSVLNADNWMQFYFYFENDSTQITYHVDPVTGLKMDPHECAIQAISQNSRTANYLDKMYVGLLQPDGTIEEKQISSITSNANTYGWLGIRHYYLNLNLEKSSSFYSQLRYVTFKSGFQWYTVSDSQTDHCVVAGWGEDQLFALNGGVLSQDFSLWCDSLTSDWQKHAVSIAVENAPTAVSQADPIDFSTMVVKATYDDGTTATLTADQYTVAEHNTLTQGTLPITVKFQDRTASFDVTVEKPVRELTGITLNKTTITARRYETPDLTGLTATLSFVSTDGNNTPSTMEVPVTADMLTCDTWGEPKSALSTIASQTATVSYTHVLTTKTAEIALTVTEPDTTKGMQLDYEFSKAKSGYNKKGYLGIYFKPVGVSVATPKLYFLEETEGAHVAEYLEITDSEGTTKTAQEWIEDEKLDTITLWGGTDTYRIGLQSASADGKTWMIGIKKVTVLAGYQWVQTTGENNWEPGDTALEDAHKEVKNYHTVENAVVKEDITLYPAYEKEVTTNTSVNANWIRYADTITATLDSNLKLFVGDTISKANVVVKAFCGAREWIVDDSLYTVECDTTTAGANTVTVTYANGATDTIDVTVNEGTAELTGLKVTKNPTKTTYDLGDYDFSWAGIEIAAVYTITGGSTTTEERVLNAREMAEEVVFGNFNVFVEGTQDVEVTYKEKTASFEAEVTYDGSYGMTLDWSLEPPFSAEKNSRNISIRIELFGKNADSIPAKACMISGRDAGKALGTQHDFIKTIVQPDFADYIIINGVTATEWMARGEIQWMGWYGRQLVITLNNDANQLCYNEEDPNYDEETEGVQLITDVVFKAGLQYYSSTEDNWPAATQETASKIKREKFMCLTHDVVLYNDEGASWYRVLKQDDEGETLASSLTVKTNPDKTKFEVGSSFDPTGMVLHAIYEDGFEEDIVVTTAMFYAEEFEEVGKKTVTIYFSDGSVDFEVEVVAKGSGNQGGEGDEDGCGCGSESAANFTLLGGALLLMAALGFAGLRARGKDNK